MTASTVATTTTSSVVPATEAPTPDGSGTDPVGGGTNGTEDGDSTTDDGMGGYDEEITTELVIEMATDDSGVGDPDGGGGTTNSSGGSTSSPGTTTDDGPGDGSATRSRSSGFPTMEDLPWSCDFGFTLEDYQYCDVVQERDEAFDGYFWSVMLGGTDTPGTGPPTSSFFIHRK